MIYANEGCLQIVKAFRDAHCSYTKIKEKKMGMILFRYNSFMCIFCAANMKFARGKATKIPHRMPVSVLQKRMK